MTPTFAASDTLGLSPVVFKPVYLKGSGQKRPNWHFGSFFIFAQKWLIFGMWPNIIKKISVLYFFGLVYFLFFQELTSAKNFVFRGDESYCIIVFICMSTDQPYLLMFFQSFL